MQIKTICLVIFFILCSISYQINTKSKITSSNDSSLKKNEVLNRNTKSRLNKIKSGKAKTSQFVTIQY